MSGYDIITIDRKTGEVRVIETHEDIAIAMAHMQELRAQPDPNVVVSVVPAGQFSKTK